jgi:hypothetical protein
MQIYKGFMKFNSKKINKYILKIDKVTKLFKSGEDAELDTPALSCILRNLKQASSTWLRVVWKGNRRHL